MVGVLLVLGSLIFLAFTKGEWNAPTATLVDPSPTLGANGTIDVRLRDTGTGLKRSRIELESEGVRTVLVSEDYPAETWRRSTVFDTTLSVPLAGGEIKIAEGPATIRVYAEDYSWLRWFRSRKPLLEQTITIDLTPPNLEVLSREHYVNQGGADLVLYRTADDATRSGVTIGDYFFPGTAGLFADATIRVAFFAVPHDVGKNANARVVTEDEAGNLRALSLHAAVKQKHFPTKTLRLSQGFLERKVPEILAANGLPDEPDLVKGYLYINRTMRRANELRIREVTRRSAPRPLWTAGFLRQPNAAPSSGFGDHRSYVHDGEEIDTQTHLGFDLASVRRAEVTAVNTGRVVLAAPLGIYGNAVIIDHGLGIFSLYGHLSALKVQVDQDVARGEIVGRTGETGLAGGDHLHFSIMLYGIHINPVEWWDARWVETHVSSRLDSYPRADTRTNEVDREIDALDADHKTKPDGDDADEGTPRG